MSNVIIDLKNTRIWKYLFEINEDYAEKTIQFLQGIEKILESIVEVFPYYTRHDAQHGFKVLKRMEQIVEYNCFENFNKLQFTASETFLLICSAYGHDLGMAIFPNEENELLEKLEIERIGNWKENKKLQAYLRDNHSNRGGIYISKNSEILGIPTNLIYQLDLLMQSHNFSLIKIETELNQGFAAEEKEIDLRQLACILCISDAIEFSDTRVMEGVLEKLKEKMLSKDDINLVNSYHENMKHFCISDSVGISNERKVIFSGTFTDPKTLSLAHKTIDSIEIWIRNYVDIDFKSKNRRLNLRSDSVIRTLKIIGFDFERIGIRLKKENIISLISSTSNWTTDKSIVIRELLQNSVEACRYRRHNSRESDSYLPSIEIICSKKDNTIQIKDNGCGMSRIVVLDNFLTVGNSRSFDPTYTTEKYNSFSRFGIGFWSVFTISEFAEITTVPFEQSILDITNSQIDGLKFNVSIKEFEDYTVFENIKCFAGTTIKLQLKNGISIEDLFERLKYHLCCSEILISIKIDQDVIKVPFRPIKVSFDEIFSTKKELAKKEQILFYESNLQIEDIELSIYLFYRIINGKVTFELDSNKYMLSSLMDVNHISRWRNISICGFYANVSLNNLIFEITKVGGYFIYTNNPSGITYTLNRLGLMPSDKLANILNIAEDNIHKEYKNFLISNNSYNAETIYNLNTSTRKNEGYSNVGSTFNQLKAYIDKIPDLISFKLFKISNQESNINNSEVKYFFIDDLLKEDFALWTFSSNIYQGQIRITPEHPDLLFSICSQNFINEQNAYFIESNKESSLLFYNDPNSLIQIVNLPTQEGIIKLPFKKINTNSFKIISENSDFIGLVSGVSGWAGSIVQKKIIGANYAFINQGSLIINKNSLLSIDVKALHDNGQIFKLGHLIKLLLESDKGFTDSSIVKYLE
jgi:Histidine kinase-, DNA gyrase B-, and HSP90-like ATPase